MDPCLPAGGGSDSLAAWCGGGGGGGWGGVAHCGLGGGWVWRLPRRPLIATTRVPQRRGHALDDSKHAHVCSFTPRGLYSTAAPARMCSSPGKVLAPGQRESKFCQRGVVLLGGSWLDKIFGASPCSR